MPDTTAPATPDDRPIGELGEQAEALHAGLVAALKDGGVDRVFLAGPLMRFLWDALPEERRGAYAESAAELEALLAEDLASGDVVMVKGSNASRMGPLAQALKARFAPAKAVAENRHGEEIA